MSGLANKVKSAGCVLLQTVITLATYAQQQQATAKCIVISHTLSFVMPIIWEEEYTLPLSSAEWLCKTYPGNITEKSEWIGPNIQHGNRTSWELAF